MTEYCIGTAYARCDKPASYIRHTQFSGSHPFCEEHAKEQKRFLKNDNYEFWEILKADNDLE